MLSPRYGPVLRPVIPRLRIDLRSFRPAYGLWGYVRSFQAVRRVLLFASLPLMLQVQTASATDDASFLRSAFKSSSYNQPAAAALMPAMQNTRSKSVQVDLSRDDPLDPARMTAYGYDFYKSASGGNTPGTVRLRGGVSGLSSKAAAGVQMIVNW